MNNTEAVREILQELLKVAREEGAKEEARLGRALTEAEAGRIAAMIERQFQTALVVGA
jgi:F0F1-type ATP synthase delta subunit